MTDHPPAPDVATARLNPTEYAKNFAARDTGLSPTEALEAAERCLMCADAPCMAGCPTEIDIPGFIGQILADDTAGAARTILEQNPMAGSCARLCPADTLCEAACVYHDQTLPPVPIAALHRHAVDSLVDGIAPPLPRKSASGQRVAVVGSGPAGLACARQLALAGLTVTLFESRPRLGGLIDFGVPSNKLPREVLDADVERLLRAGEISFRPGHHLGRDLALADLRRDFDAVCLAMGQSGITALKVEGEMMDHVIDAVDFISELRLSNDPAKVPVGRNVVVLGSGRTALDAAVQARLLGAERVIMVYSDKLDASESERLHATSKGVRIITGAKPVRILGTGTVHTVEFARTAHDPRGPLFSLPADQVLKAVGQHLEDAPGGLQLQNNHIAVDAHGRTSLEKVWAAGDCTTGPRGLSIHAVRQGFLAGNDIAAALGV